MIPFRKLLVTAQGEITISVYSPEDRFALHRLQTNKTYQVGKSSESSLKGQKLPFVGTMKM